LEQEEEGEEEVVVGSTVQLQVELMDDHPTGEARASILILFCLLVLFGFVLVAVSLFQVGRLLFIFF